MKEREKDVTTSDGRVNKGTGGSRGERARLWQEKGLIVKWMDGRMVRWKSNATGQSPTCRRVSFLAPLEASVSKKGLPNHASTSARVRIEST